MKNDFAKMVGALTMLMASSASAEDVKELSTESAGDIYVFEPDLPEDFSAAFNELSTICALTGDENILEVCASSDEILEKSPFECFTADANLIREDITDCKRDAALYYAYEIKDVMLETFIDNGQDCAFSSDYACVSFGRPLTTFALPQIP